MIRFFEMPRRCAALCTVHIVQPIRLASCRADLFP